MNGAPARRGRRRPQGECRLKIPRALVTPGHLAHSYDPAPRLRGSGPTPKEKCMRVLKLFIVAAFAALLLASLTRPTKVSGQSGPTEAPASFDNPQQTNGFEPQGTPVPPGTKPTPGNFEADKFIFSKVDEITPDGLGPVYNAQSCRECHQNPVTGAISQITELRAGHLVERLCRTPCGGPVFVDAPGGSLIQHRAIDPRFQERVPPLFSAGLSRPEPVNATRTSLNTLGDGFVEAIANDTLLWIAASQPD